MGKNKDIPIDLRNELYEELKLGKSKSALQLSALDDIKNILANYEDEIYQNISEYLITINIDEELDENLLETGDENIYWSIADVSVEKENKNIIYYVNLDIIADLFYQKDNDFPYGVGKLALALTGQIELSTEEYSTISEIKTLSIEKNDVLHIEPEVWSIVKYMENQNSCKDIIRTSKNITKTRGNTEKLYENVDINELKQTLRQYAILYENLSESIKSFQINNTMMELSKQLTPTLKAWKSVKSLQVKGVKQ